MKTPLYSQLKLKLESKGLDSITSAQIAWFGSSIVYGIVCATFLSFVTLISDIELLFFGFSIVLFLSCLYKSTLIILFYSLLNIVCVLFVGEALSIMFIALFMYVVRVYLFIFSSIY